MEQVTQIQVFNNPEFGTVRTITISEQPYFVGKDVAEILGYSDTFGALKKHVDDEDKQNCQNDSFETPRGLTVINEAGVYSLIFSSKLQTAKQFKRWVTHEVLPDIRKHGMYISDKLRDAAQVDKEAFDTVVSKYLAEKEKVKALEAQIAEEAAYTTLGKCVLALPGSVTIADAAQFLAQHGIEMGRNRLYKWGRDKKLLYSSGKRKNKPTQKGIESGIVNLELDQDGGYKLSTCTMLTAQGLKNLFSILFSAEYPLFPEVPDEDYSV